MRVQLSKTPLRCVLFLGSFKALVSGRKGTPSFSSLTCARLTCVSTTPSSYLSEAYRVRENFVYTNLYIDMSLTPIHNCHLAMNVNNLPLSSPDIIGAIGVCSDDVSRVMFQWWPECSLEIVAAVPGLHSHTNPQFSRARGGSAWRFIQHLDVDPLYFWLNISVVISCIQVVAWSQYARTNVNAKSWKALSRKRRVRD